MSILVIAEHNQQQLKPSTLNTLTAASQLGKKIKVLVAGFQCKNVVERLQLINEVEEILLVDNETFLHPLAEDLAPLIVSLAKDFSHILAPATTFGKNFMPRVAAVLDVGQVSDVIDIIDEKTYRRPIYAGNALQTVTALDVIQVLTIRISAFNPIQLSEKISAKITPINFTSQNKQSKFISEELQKSERPELAAADIVISGGRGLQNKENFARLIAIADCMHAAVGASRAAVDAGLVPNDFQVGQTGQVVAPQLYIAVGISGAIQHLAGMKDSKVIVAINPDADAPIFQIVDLGLVGKIEEIFPRWEAWLTDPIKLHIE